MKFDEHRDRYAKDEYVGRDVEDSGGNDLVVIVCALLVLYRDTPVLSDGSTPYGEEKDVDCEVANSAICRNPHYGFIDFSSKTVS